MILHLRSSLGLCPSPRVIRPWVSMSLATWSSPAVGSIWSNGSAESQPVSPGSADRPKPGSKMGCSWGGGKSGRSFPEKTVESNVLINMDALYELTASCQYALVTWQDSGVLNKTKLHFLKLSMKQWLRPCSRSPKSTAWRSILESGTIATELWCIFWQFFSSVPSQNLPDQN